MAASNNQGMEGEGAPETPQSSAAGNVEIIRRYADVVHADKNVTIRQGGAKEIREVGS